MISRSRSRAALFTMLAALASPGQCGEAGNLAPKPLFRDPVHDGAADPAIVWNAREQKWFLFYTNRRANVAGPGVSWVHGTRIGIAESSDGGATWRYRGTAGITYGGENYTYWAPEIVESGGVYHMFLSVVPGIFSDWNASREIVHLTSSGLANWKFESKLPLASDRVIDAAVLRLPNGTWRLWYKNERDHSALYYADSPDLFTWRDRGVAIAGSGEGPKVFRWKGRFWLIEDVWKGIAVFSSTDCERWTPQPTRLLEQPGTQPTDRAKGGHADIVVSGDRAFIFYFVHQTKLDTPADDPFAARRTVIQVAELEYADGQIRCDREKPVHVLLRAPTHSPESR